MDDNFIPLASLSAPSDDGFIPLSSVAGDAPKPERGLIGDLAHRLGVGTRNALEGIAAPYGMAFDAVAAPVNAGAQLLGYQPPIHPFAEGVSRGLDRLGVPRAETTGERVTGHVVQGVAGLLPSMGAGAALQEAQAAGPAARAVADALLGAPKTQALSAAAGGLAGGTAAEVAPNSPAAQVAASLAGGFAGAMVPAALRGAGAAVAGAVQPFSRTGREAIQAEEFLRQSSDPATLRTRLAAGMQDDGRRLPDQPVTTAQAAQDPGLAGFEGGVRARREGMASRLLDDVDARRDQGRITALGEGVPTAGPEEAGAAVRPVLRDARADRRAATSAAYDAVDPDGTAMFRVEPVLSAALDTQGRYFPNGSGGVPRELRDVVSDLMSGHVQPYGYMQAMRARLGEIATRAGADQPRLAAAATQVRDAIDQAAERAAQPYRPTGAPATAADLAARDAAEGAAQRPDVAAALDEVQTPASRAGGRQPESLASFIVRNGGVRDDGGEIMQALGGTVRTRPGLLNSRGRTLDQMRELAHEQGYIGRFGQDSQGAFGTTTDDFVTALQDELNTTRRGTGDSPLVAGVDRELGERGLSLTDPRQDVLGGVRQPVANPAPVGMGQAPEPLLPAPDGAFTPEQAERWRAAQAQRRQQGQDFERDATGTDAVARVLRGPDGAPTMLDANVAGTLLSNPNALRQAQRAAGDAWPAVREQLAGEFRRQLRDATLGGAERFTAAGEPVRVTSAAGFSRFLDQNAEVARLVLPPEELDHLARIRADFRETVRSAGTAARVAPPPSDLAMRNIVARVGNGAIDPANTMAQRLLGGAVTGGAGMLAAGPVLGAATGGTGAALGPSLARMLYRGPNQAMQEGLGRMAADPDYAARLLAGLGEAGSRRAALTAEGAAAIQRAALARRALLLDHRQGDDTRR